MLTDVEDIVQVHYILAPVIYGDELHGWLGQLSRGHIGISAFIA